MVKSACLILRNGSIYTGKFAGHVEVVKAKRQGKLFFAVLAKWDDVATSREESPALPTMKAHWREVR